MSAIESKPLISIVVLNWNGKRYIDPFMKSIEGLQLKHVDIEVLFTDNNSSDDSVAYYTSKYLNDKKYKLVKNTDNYGYAKGNNLGIRRAAGQYVLVCNNDLELAPQLVENLYMSLLRHGADLVVPKLMFMNKPGYINNAGSRLDPESNWPVYEIGYDEADSGAYDTALEITAFCGACVLFKRSFLETVGMFDPKFFMYFEDGDLSWRGQKAGKKFYYEPTAVAYHQHAGSSKEWSPLFTHFVFRNRILILTKNARPRIILSGWKVTLHDHLLQKAKNLVKAIRGDYPKKVALIEFMRSQKIILAAVCLTPYILLKRYKVISEQKI